MTVDREQGEAGLTGAERQDVVLFLTAARGAGAAGGQHAEFIRRHESTVHHL